MRRRALLLAVALLAALGLRAAPRVSVLTCGPGDEFYIIFGHTALRVVDSAEGTDLVYNYGTFDFGAPHFYLKFARGQMDYCLSRTTFDRFMTTYAFEGRWVREQVLALTPQEAANLAMMLEVNYRPDYRYYRYDFFRDNCATRVRDMVEGALAHRSAAYPDSLFSMSYRDAVHYHAQPRADMRWWEYGTNLLLGLRTDRRASTRQLMYMPLLMHSALREAEVEGTPLVVADSWLLDAQEADRPAAVPPVAVFSLLFAVVAALSVLGRRRGWSLVWMDRTLFILAGVLGAFLCFMWLGTSHWCTKWNMNVLWLSPLFLLLAIRPGRCPAWALWLQGGMLAVALLMALVGWPQDIGLASVPLILMLMVRVWVRIRARG